MKIYSLKIGEILKAEMNFSFLKLIYLSQFVFDLSELGLKKAFCSLVNLMFLAFGTPNITIDNAWSIEFETCRNVWTHERAVQKHKAKCS